MTSRRFLATAAAFVLTATLTTHRAFAGTFGIFTYQVVGDSVTIGWCDREAAGPVSIPALIEGKPVTTIAMQAFNGCEKITSVTLPVGVTTVGDYAFEACPLLAQVNLPEGLVHLGSNSLGHCPRLKTIHIPSTLATTGAGGPFEDGTFIHTATFAPGITQIANGLFLSCNALKDVKIPATVTRIGEGAFARCVKLEKLKLPAGLKEIGYGAFDTCGSLEKLEIPATVTTIGEYAFSRSALRSLTLPDGVKSIGKSAFWGCPHLESVKLPKNLKEIPERLFTRCKNLRQLSIPGSVTRIGAEAFNDCGLDMVVIPSKVREIGEEAFYSARNLKSAVFTGKAPVLGKRAFSNTASAFTIFLEDGTTGFTLPRWKGYPTSLPAAEISILSEKDDLANGSTRHFPTGIVGKKDSYRTFTILNTGIRPLANLTAAIQSGDSTDFSFRPLKKKSLAPGQSVEIRVRFSPTATGNRRSRLVVGSSDSNENPYSIGLQGAGLQQN